MKLKKGIGRSFISFVFGLIVILVFYQLIKERYMDPSGPLPTEFHPIVQERSNQLIQQAADKGIVMVITDGFRSSDDQDRLFEKGRTAAGTIVTNAKGGESYHNYGLAIDFALKAPSGEVIWDMQFDGNKNGAADWTEVVEMAKALGFQWGGDWVQFKDYPHLEMGFGLTIADLQNGERPADSPMTADTNP